MLLLSTIIITPQTIETYFANHKSKMIKDACTKEFSKKNDIRLMINLMDLVISMFGSERLLGDTMMITMMTVPKVHL